MPSNARPQDRLPSERQIALGEWLGEYKGTKMPDRAYLSNRVWWGWLHSQINHIDREDAREVQIDFGIRYDPSNLIHVIGALKFREAVNRTGVVEIAVKKILKGVHPYDVQEMLSMSDEQLEEAVKIVMTKHDYEIDWGSC